MDNELSCIETKEPSAERATVHEESHHWNQCTEWSFNVGIEWTGSVGEGSDYARRIEWWNGSTANNELHES